MEEVFESYKILKKEVSAQIIEKKSKFIATIAPVLTEEEAIAFVEGIKKRHWDAAHNCFAFVIGERAQLQRCSDDGEPQGTAGRPMLEVLMGAQITNVVAVVTRYFGGTLLGTGGLVRAYTQAVQEGINQAYILNMRYGIELKITADYNSIGKVLYLLGQLGYTPKEAVYTDIVQLQILVPLAEEEKVRQDLVEATAAKVCVESGNKYYFIDKSE